MQSAGYGGCRHGKGIDIYAHLFELLFHGDTEFLFFVDDEKSQVFEFYIFPYQTVCADDDVDTAVGNTFERFFDLCRCACTAQVRNFYRKIFEPFAECLVVLECQNGGGNQYGHLLVVASCFECRPYGDFGFSEAHIAADEPVHWSVAFHVGFYFGRRFQLVGCVFVDKRGFELVLPSSCSWSSLSFSPMPPTPVC